MLLLFIAFFFSLSFFPHLSPIIYASPPRDAHSGHAGENFQLNSFRENARGTKLANQVLNDLFVQIALLGRIVLD